MDSKLGNSQQVLSEEKVLVLLMGLKLVELGRSSTLLDGVNHAYAVMNSLMAPEVKDLPMGLKIDRNSINESLLEVLTSRN